MPPAPPLNVPRMRFFELMRIRRPESPWEVVDHKVVQPVPTFYDDEGMCSHLPFRPICTLILIIISFLFVCKPLIDIDILRLSSTETRGKYVFDLHGTFKVNKRASKKSKPRAQMVREEQAKCDAGRKALIFARQQLLDEVAKKDYNVLLLEGWSLTILRKGKHCRIEVQYNGRGALAGGKPNLAQRPPPFLELLGQVEV